MWCRRLVIYSAAHTLALWAMGLGFAVSALMLRSPMAALLVIGVVGVLHIAILVNAEARRIRAEALGVSFRSRLNRAVDAKAPADGDTGVPS